MQRHLPLPPSLPDHVGPTAPLPSQSNLTEESLSAVVEQGLIAIISSGEQTPGLITLACSEVMTRVQQLW